MQYFRSLFSAVFPLILFSLISIVYFGFAVIQHLNTYFIGNGTDPTIVIWAFTWWKHCILNGINPFFTNSVWYPYNYNLAQVPALAWGNFMLAAPILFCFGPIVTYNVSLLVAPAMAGWSAFFLLRYLTKSYWPSVIGAYFFGFSSYMIGHILTGHLMLVTIFLLPLIVLLTIKFYRSEISKFKFCSLSAFLLALQCYISCEVFATFVFFGFVTLCLAMIITSNIKNLFRLAVYLIIALIITVVLISPFLYFFLLPPHLNPTLLPSPIGYVSDLFSPIIPVPIYMVHFNVTQYVINATKYNVLGILNYNEYNSYFGIPALLIFLMYLVEFRKSKITKFFLIATAFIFICALGATLHILGKPLIPMPWQLMTHLPFIKYALPVRFGLFLSIFMALIIALWLADSEVNKNIKIYLVFLSIIFLIPSLTYVNQYCIQNLKAPTLIAQGKYKTWINPGDVIVILPYTSAGNSMLWQAEANMYFKLAGGYLGYEPEMFAQSYVAYQFYINSHTANLTLANAPGLLQATQQFLLEHQVKAIFVYDNRQTWKLFFQALGMSAIDVDGVDVYTYPR